MALTLLQGAWMGIRSSHAAEVDLVYIVSFHRKRHRYHFL